MITDERLNIIHKKYVNQINTILDLDVSGSVKDKLVDNNTTIMINEILKSLSELDTVTQIDIDRKKLFMIVNNKEYKIENSI